MTDLTTSVSPTLRNWRHVLLGAATGLLLWGCDQPETGLGSAQEEPGGQVIDVAGQVQDEDGRPIAGAEVVAVSRGRQDTLVTAATTSAADGTFQTKLRVLDGTYPEAVLARKEGRAIGVGLLEASCGDRWIVRLAPAGQVSGTVVDEAGRPVAAAEVSWSFRMPEPVGFFWPRVPWNLSWMTTRTDATGRFAFRHVPPDVGLMFRAAAPGYGAIQTESAYDSREEQSLQAGASDIRLVLPPEARLEGVCLDEATGRPVSGLPVGIYGAISVAAHRVTDAQGRFSVSGLAADTYLLCYDKGDSSPLRPGPEAWIDRRVEVALKNGEVKTGVHLMLTKGGLAEVQVAEAVTGKPIAKAYVGFSRSRTAAHQETSYSGYTDARGVATIRLLPEQYWLLYASGPGYCSVNPTMKNPTRPPPEPDITVIDGGTARFKIQLQPAPKLRGSVVDEQGRPVAGVDVVPVPDNYNCSRIRTDAAGAFEISLTNGPLNFDYLLARLPARHLAGLDVTTHNVGPRGYGPVAMTGGPGVALEQAKHPVDLRLVVASLAGEVVDSEGRPAVDVPVTLRLNPDLHSGRDNAGQFYDECRTDGKGRFEFQGIAPGATYGLWANHDVAPHRVSQALGLAWFTVFVPGEQQGRQEVGKIVLASAGSVSGTVVDAAGKPVARAEVSVASCGDEWPFESKTYSDNQGRFRIDRIPPSMQTVRASDYKTKSSSEDLQLDIKGTAKEVRLTILTDAEKAKQQPKK